MVTETEQVWYLKKHGSEEVFGPSSLEKLKEWASSARINPQDRLSTDKQIWTHPPMLPELEMDWLIELGNELLYGPTTSGALIEFFAAGEITEETPVVNCVSGKRMTFGTAPFATKARPAVSVGEKTTSGRIIEPPLKGGIRVNLQKRVRELELLVMSKQNKINAANEKIVRLETRIRELERRLRQAGGSIAS